MIIIFIQETNITRSVFQMVPANIKIQSIEIYIVFVQYLQIGMYRNIYSVRAVFTDWYMDIYDIPEKL
jgi:hypothetical protein